jgi:hypothetical protein
MSIADLLVLARVASGAPDWMAAGCRTADPEEWYPEGSSRPSKAVQRICADCPIRAECLAWALERDERFGVWGGATPADRTHVRRVLGALDRKDSQSTKVAPATRTVTAPPTPREGQ